MLLAHHVLAHAACDAQRATQPLRGQRGTTWAYAGDAMGSGERRGSLIFTRLPVPAQR